MPTKYKHKPPNQEQLRYGITSYYIKWRMYRGAQINRTEALPRSSKDPECQPGTNHSALSSL